VDDQEKVVLFRRRRALFWDQYYGGAPWPARTPAEPTFSEEELYRGMYE